jgi:uncharacterized protein (TIGR02271 family)
MPLDDDSSMTRSEERLSVTTRRVPFGKAVLRKVVVVEQRTITVEVAHEEVRLEIVPLDGAEDDPGVPGAHAALPELVLSEEQIVVTKRVVPVERVRLVVDAVTEVRPVTAEVRQERIDVVEESPTR